MVQPISVQYLTDLQQRVAELELAIHKALISYLCYGPSGTMIDMLRKVAGWQEDEAMHYEEVT